MEKDLLSVTRGYDATQAVFSARGVLVFNLKDRTVDNDKPHEDMFESVFQALGVLM